MAIALMDGTPRVEAYDGGVAIWGQPPGDDAIGLILTPAAAYTTAYRALGVAADLSGDIELGIPVDSVEALHRVLDDGEDVVALKFTAGGAPLTVHLDLTMLAEFAAATARLSRELDLPHRQG